MAAWWVMESGVQERVPSPTLSRTAHHWKSFGKCSTEWPTPSTLLIVNLLKVIHCLISCERLSDNCINRAGVEHLIEALQHNTKVRSVW